MRSKSNREHTGQDRGYFPHSPALTSRFSPCGLDLSFSGALGRKGEKRGDRHRAAIFGWKGESSCGDERNCNEKIEEEVPPSIFH